MTFLTKEQFSFHSSYQPDQVMRHYHYLETHQWWSFLGSHHLNECTLGTRQDFNCIINVSHLKKTCLVNIINGMSQLVGCNPSSPRIEDILISIFHSHIFLCGSKAVSKMAATAMATTVAKGVVKDILYLIAWWHRVPGRTNFCCATRVFLLPAVALVYYQVPI